MTADHEECFGLSWDAHNSVCNSCDDYEQCKHEKRMLQMLKTKSEDRPAIKPPIIPLGNLVRPAVAQPITPKPEQAAPRLHPTTQFTVPAQPRPAQPKPENQNATTQAPARYAPQQPQFEAQYFPAVYRPVQHLLPQEQAPFLTVLEPADAELPIWKRVVAESCRAALKGVLGHGTYLADHLTFYRK
jgi:hypothetical protein